MNKIEIKFYIPYTNMEIKIPTVRIYIDSTCRFILKSRKPDKGGWIVNKQTIKYP